MALRAAIQRRGSLYRGFSSHEFQERKTFKLTDFELVKMDLLNHIFTKRGERTMMPNFGTIIPEVLFEPLTPDLVDLVVGEVVRVVNFDPRVELLDIQTDPQYDSGTLLVAARLQLLELNTVNDIELNITFEGN